MSLNLLALLSSDDISVLIDKIQQNFDIISSTDGIPGSPGSVGRQGFVGPPGKQGPNGGGGIVGSIWLYSTELPLTTSENTTPGDINSITPTNPRIGDFLVLTKRDHTFSEVYRFEKTLLSPTIPMWNAIVELNTQNNLYLKLDIFRFNDFNRIVGSSTISYKSICFEDNTNANNYENKVFLQNRKDYLTFSGNNLASGQSLTNFSKNTIEVLLSKYSPTELPVGKFNILSGEDSAGNFTPHLTLLYFKDQDTVETLPFPGAGDTLISGAGGSYNSNPANKTGFNGQWGKFKISEQGVLALESTGDIQLYPNTFNQPNGKVQIFGKILQLQGTTIYDKTNSYNITTISGQSSGNTLSYPLNNVDINIDAQVELAIFPKTPVTLTRPLMMGIHAGSNLGFQSLGTSAIGKEDYGYLDTRLDILGGANNVNDRKILIGGASSGNGSGKFNYDWKKPEEVYLAQTDKENVFISNRQKLESSSVLPIVTTALDIFNETNLSASTNLLIGSTNMDLYNRTYAVIQLDKSANIWEIPVSGEVVITKIYLKNEFGALPGINNFNQYKGLKITLYNTGTTNFYIKRKLSSNTNSFLEEGHYGSGSNINTNGSSDSLQAFDIITVSPGARVILTLISEISIAGIWTSCIFDVESSSNLATLKDPNLFESMQFQRESLCIIAPIVFTTTGQYAIPANKERIYKSLSNIIPSGAIFSGGNPAYDKTLRLDSKSNIYRIVNNLSSNIANPFIEKIEMNRFGSLLQRGTIIKLIIDRVAFSTGSPRKILIQLNREFSIMQYSNPVTDGNKITISDAEFNMIADNLTTDISKDVHLIGSGTDSLVIAILNYAPTMEFELLSYANLEGVKYWRVLRNPVADYLSTLIKKTSGIIITNFEIQSTVTINTPALRHFPQGTVSGSSIASSIPLIAYTATRNEVAIMNCNLLCNIGTDNGGYSDHWLQVAAYRSNVAGTSYTLLTKQNVKVYIDGHPNFTECMALNVHTQLLSGERIIVLACGGTGFIYSNAGMSSSDDGVSNIYVTSFPVISNFATF